MNSQDPDAREDQSGNPSDPSRDSKSSDPKLSEKVKATRSSLDLIKIEFLTNIDLFHSFSRKTLEKMAHEFMEIVLKKDEILFLEGEPEKMMCILLTGELLVYKRHKPITKLKPGDYVGEMSLLEYKPRSASVKALSECVLLQVDEDQFKEYLISEPKAEFVLIKTLSKRLRNDVQTMADEMEQLNAVSEDMKNCLAPLEKVQQSLEEVLIYFKGNREGEIERYGWEHLETSYHTLLEVRNHLSALIDKSISCLRRDAPKYVKKQGNLSEVLQKTLEEIKLHENVKDKALSMKIEGTVPKCSFNVLDIKRVMQNLILNAAYFSKEGANIDVAVQGKENYTQITVRDYGSGIPDDVQPLILKEIYTSKPDGNGFGLLSCREIVQDFHQGQIWFESKSRKGTSFHFTLPHSKKPSP